MYRVLLIVRSYQIEEYEAELFIPYQLVPTTARFYFYNGIGHIFFLKCYYSLFQKTTNPRNFTTVCGQGGAFQHLLGRFSKCGSPKPSKFNCNYHVFLFSFSFFSLNLSIFWQFILLVGLKFIPFYNNTFVAGMRSMEFPISKESVLEGYCHIPLHKMAFYLYIAKQQV